MSRRSVLHVAGSPTDAFHADLSRLYAHDALELLRSETDDDHYVVWIEPDGHWCFPEDLEPLTIQSAQRMDVGTALDSIRDVAPTVVVPQMFCRAGMTDYRALFAVLGLPLVGNDAATMALAADKPRARAVVAAGGVAVPDGCVVDVGAAARHVGMSGSPLVVKPADADNSDGVSLVESTAELEAAIERASAFSDRVLVERYIAGREVRCGVVERDGRLQALPLEEYPVSEERPIRERSDKLAGGGADLTLVAKGTDRAWIVADDDRIIAPVQGAALDAYRALGCRHYGLFDFRVDDEARPWFLEAGLYCSFSPNSVLVGMARAAGIGTTDLFTSMTGDLT